MATHDLAITYCHFDAGACAYGGHQYAVSIDSTADVQVAIWNNAVYCGHCSEQVYPPVENLTCMLFRCEGSIEVWSQDGGILAPPEATPVEVHRCRLEAVTVTDEELADLLAPAPR